MWKNSTKSKTRTEAKNMRVCDDQLNEHALLACMQCALEIMKDIWSHVL